MRICTGSIIEDCLLDFIDVRWPMSESQQTAGVDNNFLRRPHKLAGSPVH
jgi:hypothetical protein